MRKLMNKWRHLCKYANERGIPVPLARDPKTDRGSVSLTLVFISFNVWLFGVIGKISGAFGGIDNESALSMFIACAGLYWGRKLSGDVSIGDERE